MPEKSFEMFLKILMDLEETQRLAREEKDKLLKLAPQDLEISDIYLYLSIDKDIDVISEIANLVERDMKKRKGKLYLYSLYYITKDSSTIHMCNNRNHIDMKDIKNNIMCNIRCEVEREVLRKGNNELTNINIFEILTGIKLVITEDIEGSKRHEFIAFKTN